jgi:hypothetical protein
MDTFKTATAAPVVDPTKHVNYTYGMVLGVDDFTQEFAYHANRGRWAARDIEGYGTLSSLRVTVEENDAGGLEVLVTAGTALSPRGQLIRVPVAQCAEINKWLAVAKNRAAAAGIVGRPPSAPLALYVVLCYRDCPTDNVPVPGEPCRSEEETAAPSRLKDGFLLELRLEAPRQTEEDAVRDFVRWLAGHTEFTDEPGAFTELEDFLARLRGAVVEVASPPNDPSSAPVEFMQDSPPDVMRVESSRRGEYLRAAFRLWTTELRPRWRPAHFDEPCNCPADAQMAGHGDGGDDCLLLAELSVPLTAGFQVDAAAGVEVNEERRPYLLHQRMIQEWLLDGSCCAAASAVASPPSPPPPAELALDDLTDVNAPAPQEGQLLTFSGGQWIAAAAAAPPPEGGASGPAGGDLSGTYPDPTVARLQTRPVSPDAPSAGDVLTWDAEQQRWQPAAPPLPQPEVRPALPFVTVIEGFTDSQNSFTFWFNLDAPENRVEIAELPARAVRAFAETNDAANDFLERVDIRGIAQRGRNLFEGAVASRPPLLRFRFDLRAIGIEFQGRRQSLLEYVRDNNLNFVGYDGRATVTAFVMGRGRLIG